MSCGRVQFSSVMFYCWFCRSLMGTRHLRGWSTAGTHTSSTTSMRWWVLFQNVSIWGFSSRLTGVVSVQRRRLPELHQNKESVGELWLGLLRFYTEEFDFKENVISIRQHKSLTTFEKQWTSKCIAIEGRNICLDCLRIWQNCIFVCGWRTDIFGLFLTTDPFDLNHNLGAGVSRKSEQKEYFSLHLHLLEFDIVSKHVV